MTNIELTIDPVAATFALDSRTVMITDRDVARDFGTFVIHCTGNPSLWTNEDYVVTGENGAEIAFSAEDGVPFLSLGGQRVELPENYAVDIGQRLIVWAGYKS